MHFTDDPWPAAITMLDGGDIEAPPALPFVGGRAVVDAARLLCREFGDDAAMAAAVRAARSRANDNAITYCRWREVGRLVAWLDGANGAATRH